MGDTRFAEKRQKYQPEHVKRGHPGSYKTNPPKYGPRVERSRQNRVLAHEPSQRRNPRNRDRGDHEGPRRLGNLAPQRAHLAHVLLTAERVDHATRTKK